MTDLETLLERLHVAAGDHVAPDMPVKVAVRRWPNDNDAGARRTVMDSWASARPWKFRKFLIPGADDFVEIAFLACVGRPADPNGRGHYLGRLQQGTPRLEVLAQLAGSPEATKFRRESAWTLWMRPALLALRIPTTFGRRVVRGVLRRIEARMGRRARAGTSGDLWRMAGAVDDRDRARQVERNALAHEVDVTNDRVDATNEELALTNARCAELAVGLVDAGTASQALAHAIASIRARMAATEGAGLAQPPAIAAPYATASDDSVTRYYLSLESVFRGDPTRVRDQMRADYLGFLATARSEAGEGPCIDLGCGRGEWLDILRDLGLEARGVEINVAMAAAARAAGHDVIMGDALGYLATLPDNCAVVISAFHLAEHLPFATLFRLVAECRRVLKPRGVLILETPNPENIWVATHTFHHDPTHGNPLTPNSLEFLVNYHGLETVAVLRLHPYPDDSRLPGTDPASERLNAMTCGSQDFAIVAAKTAPG